MTEEEKFYKRLGEEFFSSMAERIEVAVHRLPEFDWEELHTLGNHLKGSGAMFGRPTLSELGRTLEHALEVGQISVAFETLNLLHKLLQK